MKHARTFALTVAAIAGVFTCAAAVKPPEPYGPVPSARQLEWQKMEFVGFAHFTVNTFTDREWGNGDEAENVFNPTDFDAGQIVRAFRDAGMKELILTCKHHDGFCLWPSKFTEHSVKNSAWKDGKGDVVKALSDACRKYGLKFGIYLSPWDRNSADYGTPEYITYYRNQLRELLTNYGPISEVWFDGANGGDGYYGGAREKRTIDNHTYYDWTNTWSIVRELQPAACMFSDAGPDIRWVGNEDGLAGDPCWATLNPQDLVPGEAERHPPEPRRPSPARHGFPPSAMSPSGPAGFIMPARTNGSKRRRQLIDLYYESVGRGANLLLNVPPDRRGQIHENDVKSLREFRRILDATFANDLARGARVTASNTRGGSSRRFAPKNRDRRQAVTPIGPPTTASPTPEFVLDLGKPATFNVVRLREYLAAGPAHRGLRAGSMEGRAMGRVRPGTSIGNCRLVRGEPVTTSKVRLRIVKAPVCPALSEIGLFDENGGQTTVSSQ